jgi:hypothetical protein
MPQEKSIVTKRTACTLLLLIAANAFAADRVKPGQWETKMSFGAAKPMISTHCITANEAALMNSDVATLRKYLERQTAANTKGRCSVKNVEIRGNSTIVTMACGKREVVGTTTYYGDHYESKSSNGTTMVGKRLGACK